MKRPAVVTQLSQACRHNLTKDSDAFPAFLNLTIQQP